jgi:hypothetical protein
MRSMHKKGALMEFGLDYWIWILSYLPGHGWRLSSTEFAKLNRNLSLDSVLSLVGVVKAT